MAQATSAAAGTPWGQLDNAIHLLTLRLEGVVPTQKLRELRVWRDEQLALAPTDARLGRDFRTRIQQRFFTEYDYLLDENRENVLLADQRVAAMIRRHLLLRSGGPYRLLAYCVMPNHVHAILEVVAPSGPPATLDAEDVDPAELGFVALRLDEEPDESSPLGDFLRTFKQETAAEAAGLLDDRRHLRWHTDSFDFWIRSQSELEAVIDYVAQNPVQAGLVPSPEQWFFSSAHERYLHDASTSGWLPHTG
jgi:REP element-mobilizing transposase RayT